MLDTRLGSPPPELALGQIVASLLERSRFSQRELVDRTGLSKDQLSRTLSGKRQLELEEALALLRAADIPARGAVTLALFERPDLAVEWSRSGLSEFLETLIRALPDALVAEIGDDLDRINPRWGQQVARFVAQRIARHIEEMIEREEKLGELDFSGGRHSGTCLNQ